MTPGLEFRIGGRQIGSGHSPFIVAELSANHNGDKRRALEILSLAAKAGADAVKLQTYTADTITLDSDRPEFLISSGPWKGRRLYDLYADASTPWEWHSELFALGKDLGISVFSSPFDETAVDFLEDLGCPAYKIASFELVDLPLIEKAAQTGKPLIMSTGMATHDEIREALDAARNAGARDISLLHCISAYPTPIEQSNVKVITELQNSFALPVGISDHTLGLETSIAAIALGAVIVEKHFTIRRSDGGPDAAFSMEPAELAELCKTARNAHKALGDGRFERTEEETQSRKLRPSLYVVEPMKAGQCFTPENIRSVRPGEGLPPKYYRQIIGRRCSEDIPGGTPLSWSQVEGGANGPGN